jgi:hypothetical protein
MFDESTLISLSLTFAVRALFTLAKFIPNIEAKMAATAPCYSNYCTCLGHHGQSCLYHDHRPVMMPKRAKASRGGDIAS